MCHLVVMSPNQDLTQQWDHHSSTKTETVFNFGTDEVAFLGQR